MIGATTARAASVLALVLLAQVAAAAPGLAAPGSAPGAAGAPAMQNYLQPPPGQDADGRCDYFARLHRFTEESKALCDEGRQIKVGPMMSQILAQCRAQQGARYDRLPVTDLMDALTRQIESEGIGDACHAAGVQAWDLVQQ